MHAGFVQRGLPRSSPKNAAASLYVPLRDVKPISVAFTGKGKAAAKYKRDDGDDDASSHKDEDEDEGDSS